jgi:hypothetical protein
VAALIDLHGGLGHDQLGRLAPFLNDRGHELTIDQLPLRVDSVEKVGGLRGFGVADSLWSLRLECSG